jgi:hypothetical protein
MQLIKKFVSEIRSDASPAWQVTVWFGKEIGSVEYLIVGLDVATKGVTARTKLKLRDTTKYIKEY